MKAILHRLNIYNISIAVVPVFILFIGQSVGISTRHYRYIEDYRFLYEIGLMTAYVFAGISVVSCLGIAIHFATERMKWWHKIYLILISLLPIILFISIVVGSQV